MRRLVTALLIALIVLAAWVALRDWQPADEQIQARAAASTLGATLLDRRGGGVWRVRLPGALRVRCFELDLADFRLDPAHGYTGLRPASCEDRAAGSRGEPTR